MGRDRAAIVRRKFGCCRVIPQGSALRFDPNYDLRAPPPVQYQFVHLHASLAESLDAIVSKLQKLSEIEPTAAAIEELRRDTQDTNAIFHVTC